MTNGDFWVMFDLFDKKVNSRFLVVIQYINIEK